MGKGGQNIVTKESSSSLQSQPSSSSSSSTSSSSSAAKSNVLIRKKEDEFYLVSEQQWHLKRGRAILKQHPEVSQLMGYDPMMKYKVLLGFLLQFLSLELLHGDNGIDDDKNHAPSWWTWFICCYTLGGMVTGSMALALHELSHNLASKSRTWNRVIAMMANATLGIPAAATFKRYHSEHHKFLGEHTVDVDIPTYMEGRIFGSSSLGKAVWLLLQPIWYGLRPIVINTKDPNSYEIINIFVIVIIDALVYWRYGIQGLLYLLLSTILGMQWHPVAAHFVAEHYVFQDGQETYSYYGPFNWIGFNVGYHIEHHDLPFVASSRLPTLRRIAYSFYDHPHYHSWVKVLWDFVLDPSLSPFARMKRHELSPTELKELKSRGGLSSK